MQMNNTALLAGPYDWDPALLPPDEFEERLAVVRRTLIESGASALIIHGNSIEHGALAYLTGFTPKLGPAFALVPLDGALRILCSGGAGMIESAKRLTWVQDVRPIGNLQNSLEAWVSEAIPGARPVVGLWVGAKFAHRAYLAVEAAVQSMGTLMELDDRLDALRRHKSSRELTLIGESCRILTAACDAFEQATADGSSPRDAALAAGRAAYANGAQDARILASARDGGPPLAFCDVRATRSAPSLVCIAVRFAGYWSEGVITVAAPADGALARAHAALDHMLQNARPGASFGDLLRIARQALSPYDIHPFAASNVGNGVGLSLEEAPCCGRDENPRLETGGVYTLRCGAAGAGSDNALVSSMIAVGADGIRVMWRSATDPRDPESTTGKP